MTITVGVAAAAVAIAGSSAAKVVRRILPYAGRIGGVIVLLTGLYVTYYGYYEIRLFFANASPDDPIIKTAGVVPAWLAQQIDTVGVWPLLATLAVLLASAIGSRALRRRRADRRRSSGHPRCPDSRGQLGAARDHRRHNGQLPRHGDHRQRHSL